MNYIKVSLQFLISLTLFSCTEVVDIDLETAQERLVIDASINWEKGSLGNEQVIVLTKTASFYTNEVLFATGASVLIIDNENTTYIFDETTPGTYTTTLFIPSFERIYTLKIEYDGNSYSATQQFIATPSIDIVGQSTELGFDNDPEVTMLFTDPEEINNYYKIYMINKRTEEFERYYFNDQFWEGNQGLFWIEREDMQVGDEIDCYVYGITQQYQKYGEKVFILSGNRGGPFTTPPISIKGNCVNTNKTENYPYGYFIMSEFSKETYVFQ